MQDLNVRADDTVKTAEFILPEGVTKGDDEVLVDNRSWYQGWRIFGHSTLSTLQAEIDEAEKAEAKDLGEEGQPAGNDSAATTKFKLPEGVVIGDDGKLVDYRPFYQTRLTGYPTISELQDHYTASEKAKVDAAPKEEG